MKRKAISLTTKLAAALLMLRDNSGERLISHEHAKLMGAEQILSLFHWDHYPIRHEDGGPDEPWNLTPLLRRPHIEKTAKIDAPEAAKGRRTRKREAAHLIAMGRKFLFDVIDNETQKKRPRPRSRIQSRPFSKQHRPMRVRGNAPGSPRRP